MKVAHPSSLIQRKSLVWWKKVEHCTHSRTHAMMQKKRLPLRFLDCRHPLHVDPNANKKKEKLSTLSKKLTFLVNSELVRLSSTCRFACRSRRWRGTLESSFRQACIFRQFGVRVTRAISVGERAGFAASAAAGDVDCSQVQTLLWVMVKVPRPNFQALPASSRQLSFAARWLLVFRVRSGERLYFFNFFLFLVFLGFS